MNQKETTPLFPIDPNSSLLDGIYVDEIFKDKKKQWQQARGGARKPENPKVIPFIQNNKKASHKHKNS